MSAYLRGWRPTQFAGLHFITVTEVGRGCGCEQSLGAALTVLAVKRTRSHRKATRSQRVAREAHFGGRREGGRGTSRLEMSMLMFAPTRDQSAHVGGQVRVRRRELELRRRVRWVRLERRHLGDGVRSRNRRGRAEPRIGNNYSGARWAIQRAASPSAQASGSATVRTADVPSVRMRIHHPTRHPEVAALCPGGSAL